MARETKVAGIYVFENLRLREDEKHRVRCLGVCVGSLDRFTTWVSEVGEDGFLEWYECEERNERTLSDLGY